MQPHHTNSLSNSPFCSPSKIRLRVSLLVLSGLLGWSGVSYSGGPTFTDDVLVRNTNPDFILFDITSGATSLWQLRGGAPVNGAFSLEWRNGQDFGNPLVVENGAPSNAIYVDSEGQVGLGTAAPRATLHLVTNDNFAPIRFEDLQGTTQTWEISANRAGFRVRDHTDGRTRPFFIAARAGDHALRIVEGGNIGMGTAFPTEAVDVVRSEAASRFQLTSFSSSGADAPQFIQRRARGTQFGTPGPQPVQTGDNLGLFSFRGMRPNGAFSGSQATITAQATQDWTNAARGTNLVFGTTQNGTSTVRSVMEITHDGRVLINGSRLNVPDYVFADDYQLMPLDELRAYIAEHKHLPEVASETEVKAGGVDLTGTQMALLKKIEELTLYTLEQHEELATLRTQNRTLQQQLSDKTADLTQQQQKLTAQGAVFAQRLAALEQERRTDR